MGSTLGDEAKGEGKAGGRSSTGTCTMPAVQPADPRVRALSRCVVLVHVLRREVPERGAGGRRRREEPPWLDVCLAAAEERVAEQAAAAAKGSLVWVRDARRHDVGRFIPHVLLDSMLPTLCFALGWGGELMAKRTP